MIKGKNRLVNKATTGNNIQLAIQNKTLNKEGNSIWNDFDEKVSSQLRSINTTLTAIFEINKYLQEGLYQ